MKLVSINPAHFFKLLTEKVGEEESIVLHSAGMRGLQAETTDNTDVPESTEMQETITKASLVTFVRMFGAIKQGRAIKLVPTPKTWKVCFGPKK